MKWAGLDTFYESNVKEIYNFTSNFLHCLSKSNIKNKDRLQ